MLLATSVSASAASVAKLVMSPSPIGSSATVSPGTTVPVTLTAEDGTGAAVPGGVVYLAFKPVTGGGSAAVGTTGLKAAEQMFTADSSGHVTISYKSPATYPSAGCDVLHAQNASTRAGSTALADDKFCFSAITSLAMLPRPIAHSKTLAAGTKVTVTLTVLGAKGAPLANGSVWLAFHQGTGGGTATVNGVALTATATVEKTSSTGQVTIIYSTPATLPASGTVDKLVATNGASGATLRTSDSYTY